MIGTVFQVGDRWLVDWDTDAVDVEGWLDFADGHLRMRKTDPEADFSTDFEDLDFRRTAGC